VSRNPRSAYTSALSFGSASAITFATSPTLSMSARTSSPLIGALRVSARVRSARSRSPCTSAIQVATTQRRSIAMLTPGVPVLNREEALEEVDHERSIGERVFDPTNART